MSYCDVWPSNSPRDGSDSGGELAEDEMRAMFGEAVRVIVYIVDHVSSSEASNNTLGNAGVGRDEVSHDELFDTGSRHCEVVEAESGSNEVTREEAANVGIAGDAAAISGEIPDGEAENITNQDLGTTKQTIEDGTANAQVTTGVPPNHESTGGEHIDDQS